MKLLAQFIDDQPTQQVQFHEIRAYATRVDPTLRADADARARLHDVVQLLASQGVISLPHGAKSYDRRAYPPLPAWVAKPPRVRPRTPTPTIRVWPPALERAAALATRSDEIALLGKIADWMRDTLDDEPAPIEERSLEVLGDEKELGNLTGSRLFTSGALTLGLLRCFRTPLPFASQHITGFGPTTLLVVENNATYNSLVVVARSQPERTRPDMHIAWGSGRQFPVSIDSVGILTPAPSMLTYFGDLDLAGLQIANHAAEVARNLGLPPLCPATALYTRALELGTPRPDRSNHGNISDFAALLRWFPANLRSAFEHLLRNGLRVPQETISRSVLRTDVGLLVGR